jgi:signal recognition particle receptor subunit beta
MPEIPSDSAQMSARILYWGIPGAGVSTNLRTIYSRLRADRRGELHSQPTGIDPTVTYEILPIELGKIHGLGTELHLIAAPGASEQAPTRMQLLDQIDGVVLVLDSRRECFEDNLNSVAELRASLSAYGRHIDGLPVVVQYNKRDLADPYDIEELHRKLDLANAAVFEAVASEGIGVLQALTTISKRVVRNLRDGGPPVKAAPTAAIAEAQPSPAEPEVPAEPEAPAVPAEPSSAQILENAILAEAESCEVAESVAETVSETQISLDRPWEELAREAKEKPGVQISGDLRILSVGTATQVGERTVRVPLVLGNQQGNSATLALTIQLEPLLDDDLV